MVGLIGLFIPGLVVRPSDFAGSEVNNTAGYGLLFGLFPVNVLHNLFHLGIGIWGLAVAKSMKKSRIYARSLAVIYGVLAVMGFILVLNTTFGLIPLYGHDIWLHGGTAAVSAYFGWAKHTSQVPFPA